MEISTPTISQNWHHLKNNWRWVKVQNWCKIFNVDALKQFGSNTICPCFKTHLKRTFKYVIAYYQLLPFGVIKNKSMFNLFGQSIKEEETRLDGEML